MNVVEGPAVGCTCWELGGERDDRAVGCLRIALGFGESEEGEEEDCCEGLHLDVEALDSDGLWDNSKDPRSTKLPQIL